VGYDEARAARLYTRVGQQRRAHQPWHRDHDACVGCGTTVRPHHSGGRCTDCAGVRRVDAADPRDVAGPTKRCPACGNVKPVRHFSRDRTRGDGRYPRCKQCRRPEVAASSARWRAKHPERYAAQLASRRGTGEWGERYRADPETNRARNREKARRMRERHRERLNAAKRALYAVNAAWHREDARRRRAANKGVTG
jgi:hypothetical protein